ncbi:MAG: hypothetical protein O7G87_06035 [bacterium]|nr:hypothetical protein [bacterium]
MIPMITNLCHGPLKVCQLPRTWWKVILRKTGLLDGEYPDFSGGLDSRVLEVLGLDKETTLAYLRDNMPDYLTFENWVLEQKGGAFDLELQDAVIRWNASLRARIHRPSKIEETYNDIGLAPDAGVTSAPLLNSLQDWQLFYKRDLNSGFAERLGGRVVPLVANFDCGTLGVCQIPRTWYKILLKSKGLLHPDYPDMTETGLDPRALKVVNVDIDASLAFIRDNSASYPEFEAWILEQNGGELDRAPINEWNDYIRNRVHKEGKVIDIHNTLGLENDWTFTSATLLNQTEDWYLAYQDLMNNN